MRTDLGIPDDSHLHTFLPLIAEGIRNQLPAMGMAKILGIELASDENASEGL